MKGLSHRIWRVTMQHYFYFLLSTQRHDSEGAAAIQTIVALETSFPQQHCCSRAYAWYLWVQSGFLNNADGPPASRHRSPL